MKQFVISVISRLNIGETFFKVGMIQYSDRAVNEFHLNSHKNIYSLTSAINAMQSVSNNDRKIIRILQYTKLSLTQYKTGIESDGLLLFPSVVPKCFWTHGPL